MANVVLKGKIYKGVEAVKLDTEDGGAVTFKNAVLQEKTATENGEVVPDEGYDGLSKVTVSGIPDDVTLLIGERGVHSIARGNAHALLMYSKRSEIPLFDTSNVKNMSNMFWHCDYITTVPLFDTSNVTNISYMFEFCNNLQDVPLFDTSNVTTMYQMFSNCSRLVTIPLFDTSKVESMGYTFSTSSALSIIPALDARNVTITTGMFSNCKGLTEIWLRNIKTNLQVGSGSSWGHRLTQESLIHLISELRDTGSTKTLTIGNVNLEKLANVYVKTIPITDEMRAEDDLIDEKLPFEVCESTDEGATLITTYVREKNWTIK